MFNFAHTSRAALVALSTVALAALTACGGGGGGATSDDTGGTGYEVPTEGTLVTGSGTATYTTGGASANWFNAVNEFRINAGAGALTQSATLDKAARAHAEYMRANGNSEWHSETAGKPGFTGATVQSRVASAGYASRNASEGLFGGATPHIGWFLSAYHTPSMLSNWVDFGVGETVDGANQPAVVLNYGTTDTSLQIPASGEIVRAPFPSQADVNPRFERLAELPSVPATTLPAERSGTPIIVGMRNADYVNAQDAGSLAINVTEFSLKDASGAVVPSVVISSRLDTVRGFTTVTDPYLASHFLVLLPHAELAVSSTYTVTYKATYGGGAPVDKTWTFTTAARGM